MEEYENTINEMRHFRQDSGDSRLNEEGMSMYRSYVRKLSLLDMKVWLDFLFSTLELRNMSSLLHSINCSQHSQETGETTLLRN